MLATYCYAVMSGYSCYFSYKIYFYFLLLRLVLFRCVLKWLILFVFEFRSSFQLFQYKNMILRIQLIKPKLEFLQRYGRANQTESSEPHGMDRRDGSLVYHLHFAVSAYYSC